MSVPASLALRQSPSKLHSTQVPARLALAVLPQTWAAESLASVQVVPVGAGSKCGMSGEGPWHEGLMRQALVDVGMSVASSTLVEPPLLSHTTFWQSPGAWSEGGATKLPGNAQAPVPSQSVAPQVPLVGLHAAVQQWPVPLMPQMPLVHSAFEVHAVPAADPLDDAPLDALLALELLLDDALLLALELLLDELVLVAPPVPVPVAEPPVLVLPPVLVVEPPVLLAMPPVAAVLLALPPVPAVALLLWELVEPPDPFGAFSSKSPRICAQADTDATPTTTIPRSALARIRSSPSHRGNRRRRRASPTRPWASRTWARGRRG